MTHYFTIISSVSMPGGDSQAESAGTMFGDMQTESNEDGRLYKMQIKRKTTGKAKVAVTLLGLFLCMLFPAYISADEAADLTGFTQKRVANVHSLAYSADTLSFGWDKLDGAVKYEIWQLNLSTNSYDYLDETSGNSYTIKDLAQGKKFSFLIRPYRYDENEEKIYGSFSDTFVTGTKPDDVKGLVVDHTSESEVVLRWDKVSDDAEYIIYRIAEGTQAADGTQTPEQVGTTKVNSFTDVSVKSACGYTYRVVAYVADSKNTSANMAEIITATCPVTPSITQCKGGDGRVRFRWTTKEAAGTGYILYLQDIYGTYQEISRINDINTTEYIQLNLAQYMSYSFRLVQYKSYNGADYMSQPSNAVSATTTGTSRTSVEPAVYKNNKKIKKSAWYKKYADFAKRMTFDKNVIVPGIKSTNVYGFESNNMILQAVCFAGKYMLISAYDIKGEESSVVYVIKRSTGKYITTLVLPDKYHVGGIAFDGNNIWISAGTAVSCFAYSAVEQAAASGEDAAFVSYIGKYPVATQTSFISYYDDILWVGQHKETKSTKMYGYKINNKYAAQPTLTYKYSMGIPSRTQDVEFVNKKTMIISRSNQISPSGSIYYISRLERYKLDWSKKSQGKVSRKKCTGKLTMPPMMEGIAIRGKYLYVSFESAQISACPYKMDRICAVKLSKIKWKK